MDKTLGKVTGVNGNMITVAFSGAVAQNEVGYACIPAKDRPLRLMSEIVRVRDGVAVLLLVLAVAVFYYVTPDVEQEFRFITPGSLIAVLTWIAASLGFGYYVQNFADYSATYGSIGAIIVLLMYFYLSARIIIEIKRNLNAVVFFHHLAECYFGNFPDQIITGNFIYRPRFCCALSKRQAKCYGSNL